jgi:hypothetical protein
LYAEWYRDPVMEKRSKSPLVQRSLGLRENLV